MATPTIERLANVTRLERAVERLASDDANITDVRALLQLLYMSDVPMDPMRLQALLGLAFKALGRFSADVVSAPPAALNEVVKTFATSDCKAAHIGCLVEVTPWTEENGYCSTGCQVADMRNQGETWSDR